MYKFKLFTFEIEESKSEKKPKPRSGHRIVCDEKYMYSIGGYNPGISEDDPIMSKDEIWRESKPLFKELWRFNLSTKDWVRFTQQKNLPIELASAAVILHYDKLIVYGGTAVPFGASCSNRLYVCDLQDGTTIKLPTYGSLPDPQYGQALVGHEHYLYTVGGTTGYEYTCDIHRFNMRTGCWETVYVCSGRDVMEPPGRYRHELAYDGRMIYVFGGGTSTESFGFHDIPAFDLVTNRWTLVHTNGDVNYNSRVPGPRRCHGLVQYQEKKTGDIHVVISGGYTGNLIYRDIWILNLNNLQWTNLQNCTLPTPLYFHSVALTPAGKMYTFGGIIENRNDQAKRTSDVHSIWLRIPSLTEICWEALNYYHDLRNKRKEELHDMGIPIKFIKRLED